MATEDQPKDAMQQLLKGAKGSKKAPAAKPAPAKKRAAPKAAAGSAAEPQPKRAKATTAYFVFTEENRAAVRDELVAQLVAEQEPAAADGAPLPAPKVPVPLVAKALGQKWKALSDEERQRYKDVAAQKAQQANEAAEAAAAQEANTTSAAGADDAAAIASPLASTPDAAAQRDQQPASPPKASGPREDVPAAEAGPSGAPAALPKGVVKRLMMCDPDVTRASADAVWLVARAAEKLLEGLALKCAAAAEAKKRRTIQLADFEHVVRYDRRLVEAGMKDIIDDKDMFAATATKDKDAAGAAGARAAERAAAKQEAAVASIHKITTFFVAKPAEVEC